MSRRSVSVISSIGLFFLWLVVSVQAQFPSSEPTAAPYVMHTVSSQLNNPSGLWKDTNGVLYFTELGNYCARKIDENGLMQNVAGTCGGQGTSGDGGAATLSGLMRPTNIVTDTTGVVYISDFDSYKVRKVLTDGNMWTFAGNGEEGTETGMQATSVGIGKPLGLWINAAGQVYFSTYASNTRFLNVVTTYGTMIRIAGLLNPFAGFFESLMRFVCF